MRENRHEQIIQELKADEKLFVETFAFSKAKQVICQSGHVTLTGGPGEGKTLMSRQILLDQIQKGYNPLVVRERRDLDYWNPKEKTAILCDDIFGKSSLHSAADLENAKDIMDKFLAHWNHEKDNNIAIQTTKLHVIITSRNYLLKEARVFRSSHWSIFEGDRVLDLTQKNSLSENEKRKILEIHLRSITYNMQEDDMKSVITITTKSIGFPECCRLFIDTHILGYFKPDPKRFFAEPLEFLVNIIENLYIEKENYKAIFHLLILRNGSIKMQDISTYSVEIRDFLKHVEIKVPNHKDIKEAMDVLCSCFLTSDGCLVMARHPSIFDAIAYVIGCYSPSLVLKCCSLDFIYQRVRIVDGSNPTEPDCEKWFLIQILEDQFKTLAVRFAETVQEKTTDLSLVCSHQACSVQSFVRIFFKQLQARSGKMAKLLKYTKLSTLLKDKDKKCANFIYWSTWNKNGILCKRILRHCSFLETKLVKALYGATISGNTEAFSMLYKKLHPPLAHIVLSSALSEVKCVHTPQQTQDILNSATLKEVRITEPLICIAAKYGKVNILCTMEKEGFPLSVKGKNNMTPLHYACEGGDLVSAHFLITHGASVTAEALDHTLPLSMVRVESMKTQLAEFCDENLLQEVRCMLLKLKDLHVEFVTQETETTTCDFHGILQEVFTHHVYSRKHVAQLMCEDKFPENTLLWLRKQGSSNDSETIMCTAYLLETLSLYVPLYPKLMAHFLSDDVDIPDILSGVFSKSEFLDECIIRLIWSMHIMTKTGDEKLQDSGIKILSKAVTMCDKPWTKAKAIITAGVVVHSYNEQDQFNCLIKGELESIWWLLAWVLEGLKTKSKMVNIGCFQCSWFINVADILKSLNWLSFFDGTRKQVILANKRIHYVKQQISHLSVLI
ncbi:uncharacterized protein LOC121380464 [Gigantopelta aegis]|uniref:uncharacterized protein LOC121380464 n=1 Tax=Gigantopelta aegis TaxID=1735272 RepID=UPI001B88D4B7|nr:uncharacterized protein LOC121380464 [Gigantopelta aegis]